MVLTIDLAVLLAVVIIVLLRRRVAPRTRMDTALTMTVVLVFGVLIAPTDFGQGIQDAVGRLTEDISQAGSP